MADLDAARLTAELERTTPDGVGNLARAFLESDAEVAGLQRKVERASVLHKEGTAGGWPAVLWQRMKAALTDEETET